MFSKRKGMFPMIRIGNVTMQGIRTPFRATMKGWQMKKVNEAINH